MKIPARIQAGANAASYSFFAEWGEDVPHWYDEIAEHILTAIWPDVVQHLTRKTAQRIVELPLPEPVSKAEPVSVPDPTAIWAEAYNAGYAQGYEDGQDAYERLSWDPFSQGDDL